MGAGSPKFYVLPKVHKKGNLLRTIVCSRGTVTYGVAKELILTALTGTSPTTSKNSRTLWDRSRTAALKKGSVSSLMMSWHYLHLYQ